LRRIQITIYARDIAQLNMLEPSQVYVFWSIGVGRSNLLPALIQ